MWPDKFTDVAQWLELIPDTDEVGGSNPSISTAVEESSGELRGLISLVTRFDSGLRYILA